MREGSWQRIRDRFPFARRRELRALEADRTELREALAAAERALRTQRRENDRTTRPARAADAAQRAFSALLAQGGVGPDAALEPLHYFPTGSYNPYLRMLYAGLPEVGLVGAPVHERRRLDHLPSEGPFHLHWTGFLEHGSASRGEVEARGRALLQLIDARAAQGAPFVWTIHEPLPHDCRFPDSDAELRGELAKRARAIHVLDESTLDLIAGRYPVPEERVFSVGHPLFDGYYPRSVPREAARARLGMADDTLLLLLFGALRPYKGGSQLPEIADVLAKRRGQPVQALIAGPLPSGRDAEPILALGRHPRVRVLPGPVPDEVVQIPFEAADLVVLPYAAGLNSSVALLALTFGRRVVATDTPALRALQHTGLVHLAEPGVPAFVAACERALAAGTRAKLSDESRALLDPAKAASRFARELVSRL